MRLMSASRAGASQSTHRLPPPPALNPLLYSLGDQEGAPVENGGPKSNEAGPGAFITFLGWGVVVMGLVILIATFQKLSDISGAGLSDYLVAMASPLTVIGVGAAAAGIGRLVDEVGRLR